MSVRVSVVVAVYNTGEHIEPLIASLDRQTLPADEFEVIFVDDGSTDDTPARLDELAATRANVTVLHEPNSGWPGRPRNIGIERATGRYVLFVDHDDWLGDEALARMTDYADAHESDILIGRYAGHRRGVAKALFNRSRPDATLANAPLMDSLTPHKLFRAEFLRTHGLRFPEGRRRLEDHVFVVRAYFLAKRIAVYADYHCYFHIGRTDAGNAGFQRIEPDSYYGYVREVIAIIEEYTAEDPALRSRCLRRPLRQEVLSRLDGKAFLAQEVEYQQTLFRAARHLVLDTIPADVDTALTPPQQLRAYLLREGRFDDLMAYVQHQVGVRATAELHDLRWHDGALVVEFECRLLGADGTPWAYRRDASGTFLTVPQLSAPVPESVLDCEQSLTRAGAGLVARRRDDSEEWRVDVDSSSTEHRDADRTWTEFRTTATLDPQRLAAGQPLTPGVWDVYAAASQTGWSKQVRLGSTRTQSASNGCRLALLGSFAVVPYWTTPYGNLSLDVAAGAKTLLSHATPDVSDVQVRGTHRELVVRMPLVAAAGAERPAQVRLDRLDRAESRLLPASTRSGPDGEVELSAALPRLRGPWAVSVQLGFAAWRSPARTQVVLSFARSGVVSVAARPTATTSNTRLGNARRHAARLAGGARRRLGRLRRKLYTRA